MHTNPLQVPAPKDGKRARKSEEAPQKEALQNELVVAVCFWLAVLFSQASLLNLVRHLWAYAGTAC